MVIWDLKQLIRDRRCAWLVSAYLVLVILGAAMNSKWLQDASEKGRVLQQLSLSTVSSESVLAVAQPSKAFFLSTAGAGPRAYRVTNYGSRLAYTYDIGKVGFMSWVFLFGAIGSLIAIVVAHDCFSQAVRTGWLRAAVGSGGDLYSFTAGVILSRLITTITIIFLGLLFYIVVFSLITPIPNSLPAVSILLGSLVLICYCSGWTAITAVVSASGKESERVIMNMAIFWLCFTLVLPVTGDVLLSIKANATTHAQIDKEISDLMNTFNTGITRQVGREVSNIIAEGGNETDIQRKIDEYCRRESERQDKEIKEFRRTSMTIQNKRENELLNWHKNSRFTAILSPFRLLQLILEQISGTGNEYYNRLGKQVREYQVEYERYVDDLHFRYRDEALASARASGVYDGYKVYIESARTLSHLDLESNDMPKFVYKTAPGRKEALISLVAMLVTILILFFSIVASKSALKNSL